MNRYRNSHDLCSWRLVRSNEDGTGVFIKESDDPIASPDERLPLEWTFNLGDMLYLGATHPPRSKP
jgi:hypothetical protein